MASRPRTSVLTTLTTVAAAMVLPALTGVNAATPRVAASGEGATISLAKTSDGKALVGANGHSLYMFTSDSKNHSRCSAACRRVWAPVTSSGTPHAGAGVSASHLTVIKGRQVSYYGKPLYTYTPDKKAHQTRGEGVLDFGGYWYLVKGSGKELR